LVTLPIFSWAKLEPTEGEYDFAWLDQLLAGLWENRIYVCLATPTSAQPAWLSARYEDVLPVDIAGRKRTHGMRVFFCVNSGNYRKRAAAIAEQMAKRYAGYPGLVAWHVCNEYGTYCYCETCQQKFRLWLKARYGTIQELNERWNTAFWGRIVSDFDEIMLPTQRNDDDRFNPGIQLDYLRFMTDSTLECYQNEALILKQYTPEIPVFTNISGFIKKLNQFQMAEQMDLAGWDNYPGPRDEISFPALKHDIMRGLKNGASYMVTEQSPNQQNWQPYNKLKRPGEVRTLAYQGLAHGADTSLFFQMRQSIGGQEKFHGALISHEGTANSRIYREMSALGAEFAKLGNCFLGGRTDALVGILFDWENWWALELASGPTKDMNYLTQVHHYYKPFYEKNIPVDILRFTSELCRYKIIVAPLLYMLKDEIAEKLEEFVRQGGTLLATYQSGVVDSNDRCIFGAAPGTLKNLLGLWVEETDALYPDEKNQMRMTEGYLPKPSYFCSFLCDVIHLTGASARAVYGSDFYAGTPCLTEHVFGSGIACYLGTQPEDDFLSDYIDLLCQKADVKPLLYTDPGIEVTRRTTPEGSFTFVMNHRETEGLVNLGAETYDNLLTNETLCGSCNLAGRGVMVLRHDFLAALPKI
ncbi:MAG: beta-galactosidase, partial [Hungatella sp.]